MSVMFVHVCVCVTHYGCKMIKSFTIKMCHYLSYRSVEFGSWKRDENGIRILFDEDPSGSYWIEEKIFWSASFMAHLLNMAVYCKVVTCKNNLTLLHVIAGALYSTLVAASWTVFSRHFNKAASIFLRKLAVVCFLLTWGAMFWAALAYLV